MRLLTCLCLFFWCCLPFSAIAWNSLGHMVIADIAYHNLTPNARNQVDHLTSYFQKEYPETGSFLEMAYWPDALRAQKVETFTHWHYIDYPLVVDNTKPQTSIDTDNAVWAFNRIQNVVKNKNANAYERVRFLAFLVHVTADLHQPLHTVSYYSAKHPDGDRGGNIYYVRYNNQRIKMHKLWDQGINTFNHDDSEKHAHELTKKITALYPPKFFGERIKETNADHWAEEGMRNAKEYVYTIPENETLTLDYLDAGQRLVEQQVALAGYRLANLLNQMLR